MLSWKLEDIGWMIYNYVNVFFCIGLDIGVCFFMQYLLENFDGEIVDFGCGNGVIGLSLLVKNLQVKVVFVDELLMVVDFSCLNVEMNLLEVFECCEFMINNVFFGVELFCFNVVFCNLLFYQKYVLMDNIVWEMFYYVCCCLKINGELYIVVNCYLDYFYKLKKIFGNCVMIVINNKFVILKVVKQGCC